MTVAVSTGITVSIPRRLGGAAGEPLRLLDSAAKQAGDTLDRRIHDDWGHAYFLHVEGFHEARLGPDQVRARAGYVEELVDIARQVVEEGRGPGSTRG